MNKLLQYTIIIICMTLYPFILYYRWSRNESLTGILIPVYVSMIFLLALSINLRRLKRKHLLLVLAFLFVMAGDFLINLTPHMKFSVIPFTLAHIFFTLYYLAECRWKRKDLLLLIPVLALIVIFIIYNYPRVDPGLLPPFIFYLCILSLMIWRALCYICNDRYPLVKRYFIIAGAFLFFITDILVCSLQIYKSDSYIFWIWLVYPPALLLLSSFNYFDNSLITDYNPEPGTETSSTSDFSLNDKSF
jgi:hypothetical protein